MSSSGSVVSEPHLLKMLQLVYTRKTATDRLGTMFFMASKGTGGFILMGKLSSSFPLSTVSSINQAQTWFSLFRKKMWTTLEFLYVWGLLGQESVLCSSFGRNLNPLSGLILYWNFQSPKLMHETGTKTGKSEAWLAAARGDNFRSQLY